MTVPPISTNKRTFPPGRPDMQKSVFVGGGRLDDVTIYNKIGRADVWKIWLGTAGVGAGFPTFRTQYSNRWASEEEIDALFDGRLDSWVGYIPGNSIVYFNLPQRLKYNAIVDNAGGIPVYQDLNPTSRVMSQQASLGGADGCVNAAEWYIETEGEVSITVTQGANDNQVLFVALDSPGTVLASGAWTGPAVGIGNWLDMCLLDLPAHIHTAYGRIIASVMADQPGDLYILQSDDRIHDLPPPPAPIGFKSVDYQDKITLFSVAAGKMMKDATASPPSFWAPVMYEGALEVRLLKRYIMVLFQNTGPAAQTEFHLSAGRLACF